MDAVVRKARWPSWSYRWGLALALLLVVSTALAGPESLVELDEIVAGWRLTDVEAHPEYARFFFEREGATTVVEVAHWSGPADAWVVDGKRVMPAPGASPPRELLEAVLARVDARREVLKLRSVAHRPRGPPPPTPLPWVLALAAGAWMALAWHPRGASLHRAATAHVDRWWLAYLAGILVAAAAMRMVAIDAPFEADESTQRVFFASLPVADIVTHDYADQRHPPLFYLLLKGALVLGRSEAVARLPAIVASLAAIAAAFAWARRVLGPARALLVATILATSGAFLVQSRAVSDVSTFVGLSCLASVALLQALRLPERRGALVGWVLTGAALLACYYLAPLVLLGHLLVVVVHARGARHGGLRRATLVLGVVSVPTIPTLLRLARDDSSIRQLAEQFPQHLWGRTSSAELLSGLGHQLAPSVLAIVVLGLLGAGGAAALVRYGAQPARVSAALIVVAVLATTATLGGGVGVLRLKPYYGLFLLPFVALAAVASTRVPRSGVGAVAAAGLGFVLGAQVDALRLGTLPRLQEPPTYRFDALGAAVRAQPGPSRVIALPNPLHTLLLFYGTPQPAELYRHCRSPIEGYGTRCEHQGGAITTLVALPDLAPGWEDEALDRLRASLSTPAWVVDVDTFPSDAFRAYLERRCTLEGTYAPRGGLRLYRCPADAP